jgi:hypothetical protein
MFSVLFAYPSWQRFSAWQAPILRLDLADDSLSKIQTCEEW